MSSFVDVRPVGAALSTCAQTERLTKLIGALSVDANAPKNNPFVHWRTEGGFGGFNPPPPKFRSFGKVEPDCKLRGKCLVFLFQHPN